MQVCEICMEEFQCPVALPCGHIFCSVCILRAIDAIKVYSTLHTCPTCRTRYTVASLDPAVVPSHLRPHITPSVRKLYLCEPLQSPRRISSTTEIAVENGRLNAENSALRVNCEMWRKRAESHGAAMLGLLSTARLAKEHGMKMEQERDELRNQCEILKRQFAGPRDRQSLEPLEIDPAPSLLMQSPRHPFPKTSGNQQLNSEPPINSPQTRYLQPETSDAGAEPRRATKRARRASTPT